MADEKPLTIPRLIAALKEAGFTTKDDLETLRKQIDKDQFEARTEFFEKMTKPEIDKLREETKTGFIRVDRRLSRLEADVSAIKNDVKGLEEEFGVMPSRKKVDELEERVETLETATSTP